jgi:hypothetical protein
MYLRLYPADTCNLTDSSLSLFPEPLAEFHPSSRSEVG